MDLKLCFRSMTLALGVTLCATSQSLAAPNLTVRDNYSGGVPWLAPTTCSNPPNAGCAPFVTFAAGPPSGWRLDRNNTAINSFGRTFAFAFDDGTIGDGATLQGLGRIAARSRYVETRTYAGPDTAGYVIGFNILPINLFVETGTLGDVRRAEAGFDLFVNGAIVASLLWEAQIDRNGLAAGDFGNATPPVATFGVVPANLPVGFAGVTSFDTQALVTSPGGMLDIDIGPLTTGELFTIDYRMFARVTSTMGGGFASARIGDPFSFAGEAPIDFRGLSVPVETPAPAAAALFGLAAAMLLGAGRRRI